jgi:flagellar motor protein MotB
MAEHGKDDHKKKGEHGGGGHGGGGHHGPGGGGHGDGEHEGAPEWLISFADNVTLMMGFFVIMLAMNMGPKGGSDSKTAGENPNDASALDIMIAIREAFNNPVQISSDNPEEFAMIQRIIQRKGATEIQDDDGPAGDDEDLNSLRPTDYTATAGVVPFEDDSIELTGAARDTLADIASHMKGLRLIVEVRGHASAAEAYRSGDRGMKIAFDRAMTVGEALAEEGLDWRQMRLIAAGDNDRLTALVHDKAGQRRNQRVEIVVTNEAMPDSQVSDAASPLPETSEEEEAAQEDAPEVGDDAGQPAKE